MARVFGVIMILGAVSVSVSAEEPTAEQLAFFEKKIRPVLVEHCYECHAADAKSVRGGLVVDTREGLLVGGDSGPAVVPGQIDGSLLIESLRYESYEMPPKGKLPDGVIVDFVAWVEMGAPDPRDGETVVASPGIDIAAGKQFWSFQRPRRHEPPALESWASWAATDVDRFLAARWERAGLEPAADADQRTLIRRAYFDVIGLPPSPEEIDAFLGDDSPDAYARLVDRLLESPHFGERWGRHWLDLARYADTTGGGRSLIYDASWRYRDYVIASLNADKPYDRFVVEQLAGDLLPAESVEQAGEQLTATGFLLLGPHNYENQDKTLLEMEIIDEQLDTLGKVFMGMTIGCARCHDHKFDPIPTADYYAMAGILRSTKSSVHGNVSRWMDRSLPVDAATQRRMEAHAQAVAEATKRQAKLQQRMAAVQARFPAITVDNTSAELSGAWTLSTSVAGFVGPDYAYSKEPEAAAVYRLSVPTPGMYEVRVSYTAHGNRSPDARVIVEHAKGRDEARIDQRRAPPIRTSAAEGAYAAVGRYVFDGEATVTLTTVGATETVIADAVQLVPLFEAEPPARGIVAIDDLPGIVVDDSQAEFVGEWVESQFVKSYVGSGYRHDKNAGKGEKSAVFRATLPESGEYDVRLAFHTTESRADQVVVRITHGQGDAEVRVAQRRTPDVDGLFGSLGRYRFEAAQDAEVTVLTTGSDGFVIVDAVQFLPVTTNTNEGDEKGAEVVAEVMEGVGILQAEADRLRNELAAIDAELKGLKEQAPPQPPSVMAVQDEAGDRIGDCPIHIRGNHRNLGDTVARGFLQVAYEDDVPQIGERSGRLELAKWVAGRSHPLTARVFVNRVWQRLWGQGLVRTVDNFGTTGEMPSHPELLDTLAVEFMEDGWSVKRLIRRLLLSRAYQLSIERDPEAARVDPENRLLSHRTMRRLEAEAIYDAMLSLGGQLDPAGGGNSLRPGTKSEYGYQFDDEHRAVYLPVLRNRLHPLMSVFDFPNPNLSTGRRTTSTLPTQALFLLNSPFAMDRAEAAAARLVEDEDDIPLRLKLLYERAVGREPSSTERERALAYLNRQAAAGTDEVESWSGVCLAVMGSIDFRYVE